MENPKFADISFWEPKLTGLEAQLIQDVLETNYLNEGDYTKEFERSVGDKVNAQFSVATTSGTSALFMALSALDIGFGDEVIVPNVTFIATANAVKLTGARPVLVDVEPGSLNIDPCLIEKSITTKTRAIIPVHVSGRSADLETILKISKNHKLFVVEDAAEALMSRSELGYLGTIGHVGCYSFSPNKIITTGQGGMVVTADRRIAQKLRSIKDHGRCSKGTGGNDIHKELGFNFKMTNLQAAVGLGQLSDIDKRVGQLQQTYRLYHKKLSGCKNVNLMNFSLKTGELPLWVDIIAENREKLHQMFIAKGVHPRLYWHPIHTQKPYQTSGADFPISSSLCRRAMWLPSNLRIKPEEIEFVCDILRDFSEIEPSNRCPLKK